MIRNFLRYIFILLFLHSFPGCSIGQPFVSRIYTPNDGLPDAYTLSIYQDRTGYLWIGTYSGLSRFDGQHFTTIEDKNKSAALSANAILHDTEGRMWIYYQHTICLFSNDSVIAYPTSDGRKINYVFGAVQLQDGRIWALVDQGAYEFTGHQWKKIEFPDPFKGLNCRQIIESDEGLYINFEKYIALQTRSGKYEMLTPLKETAFYINIQKSGNSIYANRVNGIIKITDGNIQELFTEQLSQTTNYNFILDSKKRFWVSTEKFGILVSDPGNETVLLHTITLPFNLSTFLFEDRDHNIWATNYEGLIKISEVNFHRYDRTNGGHYEDIRCLSTDHEGHLYFASTGHGIFKMVDNTTPLPLSVNRNEVFAEDVVDGMCFDHSDALWMITRSGKLFHHREGQAIDVTRLLQKSDSAFHHIVYHENLKKVLIASDKLYIGDINGFRTWGENFNSEEILQPRFICILHDGRMLVNTINDGIFLIDQHKSTNVSGQLEISEPSKEIRIYEDPEDGIWVTKTGKGISHFAEDEKYVFRKIASVTSRDGLPNNTIVSAKFDRNKKLWLTTLSGLATVTPARDELHPYTIERIAEELGSSVLNWGASRNNIECDRFNQIWVSTFHELFRFEPEKNVTQKHPPAISIESVKLNLKDTDWKNYTDSTTGYFNIPFNPVLNYTENSLGITYRGISFSDNPGLMYSYILSRGSSDSDLHNTSNTWSEPTASNDVSFVKLPAGQYVFAVRAKEAGTSWSEPVTFQLIIQPPFWKTWWFILLSAAIIGLIIWNAFRLRLKQVQYKSDLNRQLHELEMKALKAQMNPHFIYNALNSIQSLVMDGKQQDAVKYMSKFARLLRQVLEHSGANLVTLDKELHMIDLYVQLEMLRMNAKLDYTVVLDDQILPEKEYVPPLILQPFVENALWHGLSRKEGDKKLRVEINADDEWMMITITDNGIGRQKAEELKSGNLEYPRSMGMEITGKRLSAVNSDSMAAIQIHDITDADGVPAGTQVRIRLRRQDRFS